MATKTKLLTIKTCLSRVIGHLLHALNCLFLNDNIYISIYILLVDNDLKLQNCSDYDNASLYSII